MKIVRSIALISGLLAFGVASSEAAPKVERSGRSYHVAVCSRTVAAGHARCHAHIVTDIHGLALHLTSLSHMATAAPNQNPGYVLPTQVRAAYNITGFGSSQTTVAIVDAFAYPSAEADLANFRAAIGVPPCTQQNGCLRIVDQRGNKKLPTVVNTGWEIEQGADLDTVSTMCPNCRLVLLQADSDELSDLATAVRTAARRFGPHVISNSYGGDETGTQRYEDAYNQPGIAVTASTGDSGYGVAFPSTSPHVTAVGGTTLDFGGTDGTTRIETAWAGAGSGCSTVYSEPIWQQPFFPKMHNNTGCSMRVVADVSADADPNTGVFVYLNIAGLQGPGQGPGFYIVGGTSVSNQIIAGIYGERAGPVLFGANPYLAPFSALNDVTSGSNGTCTAAYLCNAVPGYDGPTGLGTPNGDVAF